MVSLGGCYCSVVVQESLGCAAGAQASPPVATLVPAGGFPCWLRADRPFLVEGLFL